MGDRLPFRAALLTAVGVAVALAIGVVAALLIAGDDDPAEPGAATVAERSSAEPDATERTATDRDRSQSSDDDGAGESSANGAQPSQDDPQTNGGTTRFPVERSRDPDRTGRRFSVPPRQRFTGNGNALIGTVDVRSPAVVRWRASGHFEVQVGREAFPIVAPSKSGQVVVPPYLLERVRVLASRPWTITVTPQG